MKTDLSQIDDPKELKAMAYDQIAAKEQAENNLQTINQRLLQVLNSSGNGALGTTDEDLGIQNGDTDSDGVE